MQNNFEPTATALQANEKEIMDIVGSLNADGELEKKGIKYLYNKRNQFK